MRRRAVLAGCAAFLCGALAAGASRSEGAPAVPRIAVLDVERVRRTAAAVQAIRTQLGSYLEVYRTDTQKEEQEIRAAQEELAGKRAVLAAEAYAEERRKLEGRLVEAQGRVQRRRQSLERVNMEAMEQVKQALEAIVVEIARERDLSIILRKEQVVFATPSLEITDEVLRRLDQRLPSIAITDPGG
ncbi:MAG TPA: OmpH family outer membrane protein [Rhodospirillales bacterium]|nr:OmpH family outer membrane protein [Rhodospirillales bacterium]